MNLPHLSIHGCSSVLCSEPSAPAVAPEHENTKPSEFRSRFSGLQRQFLEVIDHHGSFSQESAALLREFLSVVREKQILAEKLRIQIPDLRSDPAAIELLSSIDDDSRVVECFVGRLIGDKSDGRELLESDQLMRRVTRDITERMGRSVLELYSTVTTAQVLHEEAQARCIADLSFAAKQGRASDSECGLLGSGTERLTQPNSNIRTSPPRVRDNTTETVARAIVSTRSPAGITPHSVMLIESRDVINHSGKRQELTGDHLKGKIPVARRFPHPAKIHSHQLILSYPLRSSRTEVVLPLPRHSFPTQIVFYENKTPLVVEQRRMHVTIDLAGRLLFREAPAKATSVKVLLTCHRHTCEDLTRHRRIVECLSPPATAISSYMESILGGLRENRTDTPQHSIPLCVAAAFKRDGWHYLQNRKLNQIIDSVPLPLKSAFMNGLRLGNCEEMAQALHILLAHVKIPSVVEGGPVASRGRAKYRNPGHAQVRVLVEDPIVLDPTTFTEKLVGRKSIVVTESHAENVRNLLKAATVPDAFHIGQQLREELLTSLAKRKTSAPKTLPIEHKKESNQRKQRGHSLTDDFCKSVLSNIPERHLSSKEVLYRLLCLLTSGRLVIDRSNGKLSAEAAETLHDSALRYSVRLHMSRLSESHRDKDPIMQALGAVFRTLCSQQAQIAGSYMPSRALREALFDFFFDHEARVLCKNGVAIFDSALCESNAEILGRLFFSANQHHTFGAEGDVGAFCARLATYPISSGLLRRAYNTFLDTHSSQPHENRVAFFRAISGNTDQNSESCFLLCFGETGVQVSKWRRSFDFMGSYSEWRYSNHSKEEFSRIVRGGMTLSLPPVELLRFEPLARMKLIEMASCKLKDLADSSRVSAVTSLVTALLSDAKEQGLVVPDISTVPWSRACRELLPSDLETTEGCCSELIARFVFDLIDEGSVSREALAGLLKPCSEEDLTWTVCEELWILASTNNSRGVHRTFLAIDPRVIASILLALPLPLQDIPGLDALKNAENLGAIPEEYRLLGRALVQHQMTRLKPILADLSLPRTHPFWGNGLRTDAGILATQCLRELVGQQISSETLYAHSLIVWRNVYEHWKSERDNSVSPSPQSTADAINQELVSLVPDPLQRLLCSVDLDVDVKSQLRKWDDIFRRLDLSRNFLQKLLGDRTSSFAPQSHREAAWLFLLLRHRFGPLLAGIGDHSSTQVEPSDALEDPTCVTLKNDSFRPRFSSQLSLQRSDQFAGLRVISQGESVHSVDWRASARSDRLIGRWYHPEIPQGGKKFEIVLDLALFYLRQFGHYYKVDHLLMREVTSLVDSLLKSGRRTTLSLYSTGALLDQLSTEQLKSWRDSDWRIDTRTIPSLSVLLELGNTDQEFSAVNLGHVSKGALDSFELAELTTRVTREKSTVILCTAPSRIRRHKDSTDNLLRSYLHPKGQFVELPLGHGE